MSILKRKCCCACVQLTPTVQGCYTFGSFNPPIIRVDVAWSNADWQLPPNAAFKVEVKPSNVTTWTERTAPASAESSYFYVSADGTFADYAWVPTFAVRVTAAHEEVGPFGSIVTRRERSCTLTIAMQPAPAFYEFLFEDGWGSPVADDGDELLTQILCIELCVPTPATTTDPAEALAWTVTRGGPGKFRMAVASGVFLASNYALWVYRNGTHIATYKGDELKWGSEVIWSAGDTLALRYAYPADAGGTPDWSTPDGGYWAGYRCNRLDGCVTNFYGYSPPTLRRNTIPYCEEPEGI